MDITITMSDEICDKLRVDVLHGDIEPIRSFLRDNKVSPDDIFHEVCHPAWDQMLSIRMSLLECSTERLTVLETFLRDL